MTAEGDDVTTGGGAVAGAARLARPLTLRSGLVLPNRIAKAAMTEGMAGPGGVPGERLRRLYARWAEGGAGLLVTGNAMVDGRWLERTGNVVVEDPVPLPALRAWAEAARRGGAVLVQLSHPGRQATRYGSPRPLAPSEGPAVRLLASFARPRAMTPEEVEGTVERFASAARGCQEAGFDGVQVHAAHGYLLAQFLSPLTNRREDRWGGSLEARARLLLETVRAVRARTGRGFTVSVKLNSADFQRGGFEEEEALRVVGWLDAEGVDLLEISGGNYESPALLLGPGVRETTVAREAYFLEFARRARAVSRLPLMVTGGFRTVAAMEAALAEDALDVVGLARPLALDPDFPRRAIAGEADRSPAAPFRIRNRVLAMTAEAAWYGEQMGRMAGGRDPDPGISPLGAALRYLVTEPLRGIRRGASRRRGPPPPQPAG